MALFRRRTRKPADDAPSPTGPSPDRRAELEGRIEVLTARLRGNLSQEGPSQEGPSQERPSQEGPSQERPSREDPSQEKTAAESRIVILNDLGQACVELGLTDEAIGHYEASMSLREQFGPAYNNLLSLYNDKLREAAAARDDDGIQRWTGKLDDLMALSKRVMRSNY